MLLWTTDGERNQLWGGYAQHHGYQMVSRAPSLCIRGKVQGIAISLATWLEDYTNAEGQRDTARRAAITAKIPWDTGDLVVVHEGLGSRIIKAFGGQDIELGDPVFDPLFRVKCSRPEAVPGWLTYNARRALVQTATAIPSVAIREGLVEWTGRELPEPREADTLIPALAYAASWVGR